MRFLACLDQIYSFQIGGYVSTLTKYEILGIDNHSNHLLVKEKVLFQLEEKKKPSYKMSTLHLKDLQ